MAGDTISLEDDEMQVLAELVGEALERGDSRESILADLANNGIPEEDAQGIVSMVEFELYQADNEPRRHSPDDSGGGTGWLVWIAVVVGIKVLSALLR